MPASDIIRLSDSNTTIDLAYDTTGAGFQAMASGVKFGITEHAHLWHESEWLEGEMLVRENVKNKRWSMKLALMTNDDPDEISNRLIALNLLAKKARRYWKDRNADRVYLEIQLDGATNWTRYDVFDIEFQAADIFDYYNRQASTDDVIFGDAIEIEIVTEPYGYGAERSLENKLKNSNFQHDYNSDGLADGWLLTADSGYPVATLDTGTFLIGSQSQKLVASSSTDNEGIIYVGGDTYTRIGYSQNNYVASLWVHRESGDDNITLEMIDSLDQVLSSTTYDDATTTREDSNGNTWKLLDASTVGLSGASGAVTYHLRRKTASEETTFYVDRGYYESPRTSHPDAWASYCLLHNHLDNTTIGVTPYLDIVDIPGDQPPTVRYEFWCAQYMKSFFAGIWKNKGNREVCAPQVWVDFNTTAAGGRSGDGVDETNVDTNWTTIATDASFSINNVPGSYMIGAAVHNADDIDAYFRAGYTADDAAVTPTYTYSEPQLLDVDTKFKMLLVGPFQTKDYSNAFTAEARQTTILQMKRQAGSGNAQVDFFEYFPVNEKGFIVIKNTQESDQSVTVKLAKDRNLWRASSINTVPSPDAIHYDQSEMLGDGLELEPRYAQRLVVSSVGDDSHHELLTAATIYTQIFYRPRTEFLLGTE